MNDKWIKGSFISNTLTNNFLEDKELWIDRMGLFETGWILFAGSDRYEYHDYGYPGRPSKNA